MMLVDYYIRKKIELDGNRCIYKAERRIDNRKVILKIIENSEAQPKEAEGIINEYKIASSYFIKGLPHYLNLDRNNNQIIAVIEDIEGISLAEYIKTNKPDILSSIRIAINIADILQHFFEKELVHLDLCSANMLINPKTLEIDLIDFSNATSIDSINKEFQNTPFPQSSFNYTSPELTGRLKSEIDIRSDLYSAGAIFYELFTGRTPFKATDTLSLIHKHIAKKPLPPNSINDNIPSVLNNIILKLLNKHAADRYQSPFGLKADLDICAELISTDNIHLFELGQRDFSAKLQTPKQFYGRRKEVDDLQKAFISVKSGMIKLVMVEGFSGIGKSALVHQVKDFVEEQGGIFTEGKFEQFQKRTPYFAFIQAFKKLIDHIIMQSAERIAKWKADIEQALGENGKLLTDIVPRLEFLIGPQPPVQELPPNEAQNRFHYVFLNFLRTVAQEQHVLVIFFDDVQWIDAASSSLLKIVTAANDLKYLLFIGAYRRNEIEANSIASVTLSDIQNQKNKSQNIVLSPLDYANVSKIIKETLQNKINDEHALINLIYQKSQGNPFFINAFLKALFAEKMLVFDFDIFKWVCDFSRINQLKFTEDIVVLMAGRIQKLPYETQYLLKLAACLGYRFDSYLLMNITQQKLEEINKKLSPAIDEGFVKRTSDDSYSFTHDRIQQASYSLIEKEEKSATHLNIGKALLQNLSKDSIDKYIFEIVEQLNASIGTSAGIEGKNRLPALNLQAGIKAKNSAAYKSAFEYLHTGINLLNNESWITDYNLTLELYTEGAESGLLSGNYALMEEWVSVVLKNASTVLDKVKVCEIRIKAYTAQHRLFEAVETSLQTLQLLKVRFPKNPNKMDVALALLKVKFKLAGKPLHKLIDLPYIKDPYAEAAIRLLASVGSAAYIAKPILLPLICAKAFGLMLKNGNSPYSGVICSGFALVTISGVRDYKTGWNLGQIGLQLSEKFETNNLKCQSRMMFNSYVLHLKEHIKFSLEPLYNNYWFGLENGNIEFAAYSAYIYSYSSFFCGHHLKQVTKENIKFCERLKSLNHESAANMQRIFTQTVLNLHEPVNDPVLLIGTVFDEKEMLPIYKEDETSICILYLYKMILAFLFEQNKDALHYARETKKRIQSLGSTQILIFFFYDSLVKLSLMYNKNSVVTFGLLREVKRNINIIKKFVRFSPVNGLHRLLLVKAELKRVQGKAKEAAMLYDKSIEEAKKNSYTNDVALAFELAGRFYKANSYDFIAEQYLSQAYRLYEEWGAHTKAASMKHKYAFISSKPLPDTETSNFTRFTDLTGHVNFELGLQRLDLSSIMKAATAISGEVQLDKLLKKLVRIAVENAGAQQGYLILKKDDDFYIEAQGSVNAEEDVIVQSISVKASNLISEALMRFVVATKDIVVIDDAVEHPNFSSDPVLIEKKSRSILCMPIIYQGEIMGILYFENDLITNAFTEDRVEVIKLLLGQMAVSLQNAINEQKKMNALLEREKLIEKINLHQQELLKTKLEIQEQTYHNISEELHDNIGQVLSVIKLNVSTIDLDSGNEALNKLAESESLLAKAIQDIRDVAKTLNTDFIEKIGLVEAIENQLRLLKKTGLYITELNVNGNVNTYDAQSELILFRIIQELLNNIVKHAESKNILIIMEYMVNKLIVTIKDDGKGFDIKKHQRSSTGLGLRNIYNRIAIIKGTISFESEDQKGTTTTIEVPIINPVNIPLDPQ